MLLRDSLWLKSWQSFLMVDHARNPIWFPHPIYGTNRLPVAGLSGWEDGYPICPIVQSYHSLSFLFIITTLE